MEKWVVVLREIAQLPQALSDSALNIASYKGGVGGGVLYRAHESFSGNIT